MADKVKETLKEELQHLQEASTAGIKSGTYVYPLRGIVYFLGHSALWKPLLRKLPYTLGLGIGVTGFMFAFTYLPQLAICFFTSGPIAAITTALLVLSESSTITMVLSKAFLIEDSLIDVFDGTLIERNQAELVAKERQVKSSKGSDAVARLGKLVGKPFAKFTPTAIIRYLMYLPLNLIPIVGTVMFVLLQGKRYGPNAHSRYFQLKGMSRPQQEQWVDQRKYAYTAFGVPATLLETIPIAGIFFAFTNTCGAALWAADLEASRYTSVSLKDQAKKATASDVQKKAE